MTPTSAQPSEVDVAVIGAGTAGLAAYRAAAAHGGRVVMIEGGPYGTTCARVGCMPSKLLIAAAEAAHHARHTEPFGVSVGGVQIDRRAVMERVRRERDRFVGFVVDSVDKIPAEHRMMGRARFVAPGLLEVGEQRVRARSVVIATGSAPVVPPMLADLGDRLIVNDHVFDWNELPESVAVFGAGVIGLEIGQALHRLGVRMRLFGRGTVGPLSDPALVSEALRIFGGEFPLHLDATVHGVQRKGDQVEIDFEVGGERRRETFAYVLAATGRRPNFEKLGLESAGVAIDGRGVPVVDRRTLQCGSSSVFVAGDATHDTPLLHEAADEGKIAGDNAARFPDVRPGHRRSLLAVVFSDPQIAIIGTPWSRLSGRADVVVGEVNFNDQGRSRVMLQNRGLLHVYAEAGSGRFLGAEMVGPRAEHLGHLLAWTHQQGLTVAQMLDMPFYHPVIEEGLRTALRDALAKLNLARA